jgi:hypothetical protein
VSIISSELIVVRIRVLPPPSEGHCVNVSRAKIDAALLDLESLAPTPGFLTMTLATIRETWNGEQPGALTAKGTQ